jgi:hypothetical protein
MNLQSCPSQSAGLPSNTVLGPGFGVISKTAGSSRQIQLSRTVIY